MCYRSERGDELGPGFAALDKSSAKVRLNFPTPPKSCLGVSHDQQNSHSIESKRRLQARLNQGSRLFELDKG